LRREGTLSYRGVVVCVLVLLIAGVSPGISLWAADVCPKCGAPLPPGALFCTACGAKLSQKEVAQTQPTARADVRDSTVHLVAAFDKELTSTRMAIAFGSGVRVDSILGSAFAIAPREFVTDSGLVLGSKEITLRTAGGKSAPAQVIGVDPLIGISLLSCDLKDVPPVRLRTDGLPRLGESLGAVGFPSGQRTGQEVAISQGVASGLHRQGLEMHPIEDYIQTDASLPSGFAGGPVVDSEGRLVGMSTAWPIGRLMVMGPHVGIGLSIPTDWVKKGIAWIRAGRPARPWIGIHAVAADAENRMLYSLPAEVRGVVEDVFPGSPAASAGLRRGDGLLRVHGEDAVSQLLLHTQLLEARPGDNWVLEIARGNERLSLTVMLGERPERPRLAGVDVLRAYGGFELAPQGSKLQVTRLLSTSEASHAKIEEGDVLQSVFSKKDMEHFEKDDARWRSVKDLDDLAARLQNAYSDFDFFVGLRFLCQDGEKRYLSLYEILVATDAL